MPFASSERVNTCSVAQRPAREKQQSLRDPGSSTGDDPLQLIRLLQRGSFLFLLILVARRLHPVANGDKAPAELRELKTSLRSNRLVRLQLPVCATRQHF